MRVCEKVKEYIKKHGIKQTAIAKKCGMEPSTLSSILNGKRKMYADDLKAICFALNVSPEIFVDFEKKSA